MRIATLVTTAALVLVSTIASAQNVTYDFDRSIDFSKLRTYTWVRGTTLQDPLNHQRVVDAIETQLAQKGFIKVDSIASADVLVAYHATFDRSLQINGFSSGWGAPRFGGSLSGSARAEQIQTGTLVVDMVNTRTRTIMWRGIASKDIDVNAKPEKREKNINRTAEKLFKNYPPKP
jgi:hypothetical protein